MRRYLLHKWKDSYPKIDNKHYQLDNGVQVVVSINPYTVNTTYSIFSLAGANYDNYLGLPEGTHHLLEHILFGQPNKYHKNHQEKSNFLLGNKSRPSIESNAEVTRTRTTIWGFAHNSATKRTLRATRYPLSQPRSYIYKYLEKERPVVLNEINSTDKLAIDSTAKYTRYVNGERYPEEDHPVFGYKESVENITVQDLLNARDQFFTADNTYISLLLPGKPDSKIWDEIYRAAEHFQGRDNVEIPYRKLENKAAVQHFQDKEAQNVFISFNYISLKPTDINYHRKLLNTLFFKLLRHLGLRLLRQENQLVYDFSPFDGDLNRYHDVFGFRFSTNLEDIPKALELINELYQTEMEKFLRSTEGERWFASAISDYLFETDIKPDPEHAEDIAIHLSYKEEVYTFSDKQAKKAAKETSVQDLIEFSHKILDMPAHLWIVSAYSETEVVPKVTQSSLYNHLENLPERVADVRM